MKTILVLAGGSDSDGAVFKTALGAARPLEAHLDFLHIRISPGRAAWFTPHIEYAQGAALRAALDALKADAEARSAGAALHFRQFCEAHTIRVADTPDAQRGVSASWCEARDETVERVIARARHHDLIVLGRPTRANGLPPTLIELVLIGGGRPVLVAPQRVPRAIAGTVLVCWKETAPTARALEAALPLLAKSRRVVVAGVEEKGTPAAAALEAVARQLAWHGISAQFHWVHGEARGVSERLEAVAAECAADLLVMGAYSRSPTRERIFGGCTQHFIDHAERPVLLMH